MMIRSLWTAVMDNPTLFKRVNGWLTVAWLVAIPVCYVLGLLSSVIFISALSLYAIVTGHLSTWQAARVEVNQQDLARQKDDGFEARIEQKIDEVEDRVS